MTSAKTLRSGAVRKAPAFARAVIYFREMALDGALSKSALSLVLARLLLYQVLIDPLRQTHTQPSGGPCCQVRVRVLVPSNIILPLS